MVEGGVDVEVNDEATKGKHRETPRRPRGRGSRRMSLQEEEDDFDTMKRIKEKLDIHIVRTSAQSSGNNSEKQERE